MNTPKWRLLFVPALFGFADSVAAVVRSGLDPLDVQSGAVLVWNGVILVGVAGIANCLAWLLSRAGPVGTAALVYPGVNLWLLPWLYLMNWLHWDLLAHQAALSPSGIGGTLFVTAGWTLAARWLDKAATSLAATPIRGWMPIAASLALPALWVGAVSVKGVLQGRWHSTPSIPGSERSRPNMVLFVLDTFRADLMGSDGSALPLTPAIDRLARESLQFEQARTVMPLTAPAFTSLLTGVPPQEHGVLYNGIPYRHSSPLISEVLQAEGYFTAAVVSGFPLRDSLLHLGPRFDLYFEETSSTPLIPNALGDLLWFRLADRLRLFPLGNLVERPATKTARVVRKFLGSFRHRPFFLLVHFYDPHTPYEPSAIDASRSGLPSGALRSRFVPFLEFEGGVPRKRDGASMEEIRHLYRGEAPAVDRAVGDIMGALEAEGVLTDTMVVLTADHGENLGEDGIEFDHGPSLHDAALRVPLLVRLPGGIRADVTLAPVSTMRLYDLMAWTGTHGIPAIADVHRLLTEGQPVISMCPPVSSATDSQIAVSVTVDISKAVSTKSGLHCVDLSTDPGEMNVQPCPGDVETPALRLLFQTRRDLDQASKTGISPQDSEELRALGYVR